MFSMVESLNKWMFSIEYIKIDEKVLFYPFTSRSKLIKDKSFCSVKVMRNSK